MKTLTNKMLLFYMYFNKCLNNLRSLFYKVILTNNLHVLEKRLIKAGCTYTVPTEKFRRTLSKIKYEKLFKHFIFSNCYILEYILNTNT